MQRTHLMLVILVILVTVSVTGIPAAWSEEDVANPPQEVPQGKVPVVEALNSPSASGPLDSLPGTAGQPGTGGNQPGSEYTDLGQFMEGSGISLLQQGTSGDTNVTDDLPSDLDGEPPARFVDVPGSSRYITQARPIPGRVLG